MSNNLSYADESNKVLNEQDFFENNQIIQQIVNAIPSVLLVLDKNRKIVYKNDRNLHKFSCETNRDYIGKDIGDFLHCINATNHKCGSTPSCTTCGSQLAIINSQNHKQSTTNDCRIRTTEGKALDLRIWARPFDYNGQRYTICSYVDIQAEKRQQLLEKTLLHDISQTISGITLSSELLTGVDNKDDIMEYVKIIRKCSDELFDQIDRQKSLLQAESDNIEVNLETIDSCSFLKECALPYLSPNSAAYIAVIISGDSDSFQFTSDRTLLYKVVRDMLKNAYEASTNGETVTLKSKVTNGEIIFSVHNSAVIPKRTKLQIFQRSFSTKGYGRGFGTYCMKLFGESCLKGRVWFESTDQEGTTFNIALPKTFPRFR